jgi:hypothetical protein
MNYVPASLLMPAGCSGVASQVGSRGCDIYRHRSIRGIYAVLFQGGDSSQ